ncbi:MAG: hypothetical protein QM790_04625 [Nibricoccus sp.]
MKSLASFLSFAVSLSSLLTGEALAAAPESRAAAQPSATTALFSASDTAELAKFERKAVLAKRLGATHVPLTENLPTAQWQFQPANDPYPAWYIQRPDFLKLYPPAEVAPYVDNNYAARVTAILEERCKILRKLGLKAHWASNIPQVMPEAFFTAYPHLRGPRVDQPNRSRTARFSMCVDQPDTIRLYREALQTLLKRCPEVETFSFLTEDSGSGFCWVPALYPGPNGPSECEHRPMSERISSYLVALKDAAKEVGHEIEINLNPITPRQWMTPSLSPETLDATLRRLPRGIAVLGREGPDGRPFGGLRASDAYANGAFYPVVGLIVPDLRWLRTGKLETSAAAQRLQSEQAERNPEAAATPSASEPTRRLVSLRPDEAVIEFNARLYEATKQNRQSNVVEKLATLRSFAASEAGEKNADTLLATWLLLDDAGRRLEALDFGDMIQFGHVLNRWINRPMVPFPSELSAADKSYYRPFLFQAKGEEQADNLIDIQAMRMYEGYGARLLFQRVIETVVPDLELAIGHVRKIRDSAADSAAKERWNVFARRLEVTLCLLRTADNMVSYQAQLDRVKSLGVKPEANPPLGAQNSWDRTDLVGIARREVDNTVRLLQLLQSTSQPLLDLAPVAEEETIMRLGPNLPAQLKRKIDIMNAHWMDYDRLFTAPNP